jgi:hypothetical protein
MDGSSSDIENAGARAAFGTLSCPASAHRSFSQLRTSSGALQECALRGSMHRKIRRGDLDRAAGMS